MNGLSWFLYFVDIIGNIQGWFVGAGFLVAALGIGFFIAGLVKIDSNTTYHGDIKNSSEHQTGKKWRNKGVLIIPLCLLPFLFASIVPSKEALYTIAASQIGEQVIKLEQVQSIGGEIGGLAEDTIALLREKIQEQREPTPETNPAQ